MGWMFSPSGMRLSHLVLRHLLAELRISPLIWSLNVFVIYHFNNRRSNTQDSGCEFWAGDGQLSSSLEWTLWFPEPSETQRLSSCVLSGEFQSAVALLLLSFDGIDGSFKGTISSWSEQTFNRAWNRCPSLSGVRFFRLWDFEKPTFIFSSDFLESPTYIYM